jgi:hypothetical protein
MSQPESIFHSSVLCSPYPGEFRYEITQRDRRLELQIKTSIEVPANCDVHPPANSEASKLDVQILPLVHKLLVECTRASLTPKAEPAPDRKIDAFEATMAEIKAKSCDPPLDALRVFFEAQNKTLHYGKLTSGDASDCPMDYAFILAADGRISLHLTATLKPPANVEARRPLLASRLVPEVLHDLPPRLRELLVQFLLPKLGE